MATAKKKKKQGGTKLLKWVLILIVVIVCFGVYKVFGPNTGSFTDGEYLYIHTNASYEQVLASLKEDGFVRDITSFDLLAKKAGYPQHVGAGKYHIAPGMSNYKIVRMLRAHRQTPVKLVINKLRTKTDFIRFVSQRVEADSLTMQHLFADEAYLQKLGLDTNTVMCAIIPDTYEFYWNVSAETVFEKIRKNYVSFWTDAKKAKAKAQGLTPNEAIIVASIVDEETNNTEEKKNVASVYLNRLRKDMKLQADPTARFAWGDFTIKRIVGTQINLESPYNTYYVTGLPPGPICTPSRSSINAVLNAANTSYLYFCAKGDGSGTHLFAATYAEHIKNAHAYQDLLNKQGIH